MLIVEENAVDTALYGFDSPVASSVVKTTDGRETKFILGDATKGNNGYYFMVEGDPSVYTVSTVVGNNMLKSAIDFREKKILNITAEDITEISMTVNGTGEIKAVKIDDKENISSWQMLKPYDIGIYDDSFNELVLNPLVNVSATNFLSDNPTDEQLENSGLKDSELYYEVKTKDSSYKIVIGHNYEGNYVVKRDDIPTVFLVPQSNLSFLFADIFDYIFSYAYVTKTEDINSISSIIDGKEYEILCDLDNSAFSVNGIELTKDDFVNFYHEFFGIKIQGHTDTPPADVNNITFEYSVNKKDDKTDRISFIYMNGKYSYMMVNDKIQFYVFNEDVERIKGELKNLEEIAKNTETIPENESTEPSDTGFNWISLLVVIVVLALIAVFPISLLLNKKNK